MEIPIKIKYFSEITETKVEEGSTVEDVVKKLGFNLETVVVKLNEKIVTEDAKVKTNDELTIIRVITGG
ncbi:MAG: MoaD/ThiS family protein [Euryarchaeota archaeon]|nr:MoaD/ThiS family protein [Euryarchaeota archaeon]